MILESYYLQCLSHASYLVIDEVTKLAVVIDPQRDIDQYVRRAEEAGARISMVFLTHFHADFLAGHLELRERVGAKVAMGWRAEAEFEFTPLRDETTFEFGDVRFEFRETPGHTPESTSIVLFDRAKSVDVPYAVFTGDTLFVGDVGRPDLMSSVGVTAEELAATLYDSLHQKLMTLPDDTLVYPAHGAGSMCGKNLSTETFTTIGAQRTGNPSLQPMSRDEFVALVTAGQPTAPAYFAYDADLNRREHPTLASSLEGGPAALSRDAFDAAVAAGAHVLDVRDNEAFLAGHHDEAVHVALNGRFATWCGTLLTPDRPIVLIADTGDEREAMLRLGRIGFDRVSGYLEGGWTRGLSEAPRWAASQLAQRLHEPNPPTVIDVRMPGEFEAGHIPSALNIPLTQLRTRLDEIPTDGDVVLVCRTGYRSATAISVLRGGERIRDLRGGMEGWQESQNPVTQPTACH